MICLSIDIISDECPLVDKQVIIAVQAVAVLFGKSGVQVSGLMIPVVFVVNFHPQRTIVTTKVEPPRMIRRVVLDSFTETPVSSLAAPFPHGLKRNDLSVYTISCRYVVLKE